MKASTQPGDAELNSVDSVAAQLTERFAAHDKVEQEPASETEEVTEDTKATVDDEVAAEQVPDDDESDQEQSDETDAASADDEPSFQSVTELAEALEMPVEDFMAQIKIKAKVNGEESEVTLSNLLKGYQLESDYTRKNQAFVEEQKQFNEQREIAKNQVEQQLQRAGHAYNLAQQQLMRDFESVDWPKLQAEDPTQYMLKRQQLGERQAQLNQQIEQASRDAQAFQDQQKAETQAAQETRRQKEKALLLEAIPEWKDESVSTKEYPAVINYLYSKGFSESDLDDHRLYVMARDAMNAKQVKSDIDLAKKKVKKVPKLVKGNARQNVNQQQKRSAELKAKLKKTGDVKDLGNLLAERFS